MYGWWKYGRRSYGRWAYEMSNDHQMRLGEWQGRVLNVFGAGFRAICGFSSGAVFIFCMLAGLSFPANAAQPPAEGEKIVKSGCVGCHRIEGAPMPRSTKQAPDLIWAGNKYQRAWLVAWLAIRRKNCIRSVMTLTLHERGRTPRSHHVKRNRWLIFYAP